MLKCTIYGNIGSDAKITTFENNKFLVSFPVASTERYKNQAGEKVERTTWVKCNLWNKGKTLAEHLKKGKSIHIEGTPTPVSYKDKEGKDVTALEIQIREIHL